MMGHAYLRKKCHISIISKRMSFRGVYEFSDLCRRIWKWQMMLSSRIFACFLLITNFIGRKKKARQRKWKLEVGISRKPGRFRMSWTRKKSLCRMEHVDRMGIDRLAKITMTTDLKREDHLKDRRSDGTNPGRQRRRRIDWPRDFISGFQIRLFSWPKC